MLRVRGVYATALTKILSDMGYSFSDISDKTRERFRGEIKLSSNPPRVTIKDLEGEKGVAIIGERNIVKNITYNVSSIIPSSIVLYVKYGPYTSFLVKIKERIDWKTYEVELPDNKSGVMISKFPHAVGSKTVAHIIKPSIDSPLMREGLVLFGDYVRIIEGGKHSVSKFIRSEEKRVDLLSLAVKLSKGRWGIRFRSSSKNADLALIMDEITKLIEEGERILKKINEAEPPLTIFHRDSFSFIRFPPDALRELDRVRNRQLPTLPYHHALKSLKVQEVADKVDFVEEVIEDSSCISPRLMRKKYLDTVLGIISSNKDKISIYHDRVHKNGYIWNAKISKIEGTKIICTREVAKPEGIYDGLMVQKEKGDRIITLFSIFSRFILHSYYDKNQNIKGVYVNINTPIDVNQTGYIWYIDLGIDVVKKPGEKSEIVDLEEYYGFREVNVSPLCFKRYLDFANNIKNILDVKFPHVEEIHGEIYEYEKELFNDFR